MPITLDGTNGITTPTYGGTDTAEYLVPVTQFKNRIINGAMVIDQRNGGASVNVSNATTFTLDRWIPVVASGAGGVLTVQRSTTAPAGFINSLSITTQTADASIGSGEFYFLSQRIEGFNVADFGWGTANAETVTLSFWVRSSLTGTFSGGLRNNAANRSYVFTYTISAANTWEYKTVTITGDTTGTWLTDNSIGVELSFDLGSGSSFNGTAGTWNAGNFFRASGAVNVIGTLNATFLITGVQLEKGSTATSFDYRPYGTELALCQRYFAKTYNTNTAVGTVTNDGAVIGIANATTANRPIVNWFFPVVMRANPTCTLYSPATGTAGNVRNISGSIDYAGLILYSSMSNMSWYPNATPNASDGITAQITASIEL